MTKNKESFILEFVPKPSAPSQHSKAILTMRKADDLFSSLELYNGSGVKWKVLTRSDFRPVARYVVPFAAVMEELIAKHTSTTKVEVIRCDTGLADDVFSPGKLERTEPLLFSSRGSSRFGPTPKTRMRKSLAAKASPWPGMPLRRPCSASARSLRPSTFTGSSESRFTQL